MSKILNKKLGIIVGAPWEGEKDLYKFREPTTGFRCIVVRMSHSGSLNGYVEVPRRFKLASPSRKRGKKYVWKEERTVPAMVKREGYMRISGIDVHGGLTFSGHLKSRYSKRLVVGFDCAHYGDLCPGYDWIGMRFETVYRNFDYVKSECFNLAKQLAKLHGAK